MMKAFRAPRGSDKLALERRALLIQLGGYTYNGDERLYSQVGQSHLDRVSARKARLMKLNSASPAAR